MYEESERERGRWQASPPIHITVGLELSQTQYSLSVELISHVEPTTRGGRETAGQDKTVVQRQSERERGKRQHSATGSLGHSVVF